MIVPGIGSGWSGAVSRSFNSDRIFANQQVPDMFAETDQEMLPIKAFIEDLIDRKQGRGDVSAQEYAR